MHSYLWPGVSGTNRGCISGFRLRFGNEFASLSEQKIRGNDMGAMVPLLK